MRYPWAMATLTGAVAAAMFGVSTARAEFKPYDASSGLLWHLSGENPKGLIADVAFSEAQPYAAGKMTSIPGAFGKGMLLSRSAVFPMRGNISLFEGTLAFWFKMPDKAGNDTPLIQLTTASVQDEGSRALLTISVSPAGNSVRAFYRDRRGALVKIEELEGAIGGGVAPRIPNWPTGPDGKLPQAADGWHHAALAWDWTWGIALYVDGQRVAQVTPDDGILPAHELVGFLRINPSLSELAVDEIKIFDRRLNEDSVARLALANDPGELPKAAPAPLSLRSILLSLPVADAGEAADLPVLAAGQPWLVRQAEIQSALNGTSPGWLAVDGRATDWFPREYKSVHWEDGGGLHLKIAPGPYNWMRIQGPFLGDVYAAPGYRRPAPDKRMAELRQEEYVASHALKDFAGTNISFWRKAQTDVALADREAWEGSRISSVNLFRVEPSGPGADLKVDRVLSLDIPALRALAPATGRAEPEPLGRELIGEELINDYCAGDRNVLAGRWGEPGAEFAVATVEPLRSCHIVTPPAPEDLYVAGLRVVLKPSGESLKNTVLRIIVHHPVNRASENCTFDCRITGAGSVDLTLDTRDFIVPKGERLWITLVSREKLILATGGPDASRIELLTGDKATIKKNYFNTELNIADEYFLYLSEPRQWGAKNEWNGEFRRMVDDLHRVAPSDPATRALWAFTRGDDLGLDIPIPMQEGVPQWALLQRDVMAKMMHQFRWWVENKRVDNGEVMAYDDDTDWLADLGDLPLISDLDGELHKTYAMLGQWLCSTPLYGKYPVIWNGLNVNPTDNLHAYEEGMETISNLVLLDYGNPIYVEECMKSFRRYYDITETDSEGRWLTSTWFGAFSQSRMGKVTGKCCIYHAGYMLAWYNRLPQVRQFFTEVGDFFTTHDFKRPWNEPPQGRNSYGWFDSFYVPWRITGDDKYMKWFKAYLEKDGNLTHFPNATQLMDDMDLSAYYAKSLPSAKRTFDDSLNMGILEGNSIYEDSYLAWKITGNKTDLIPALRALYRRLTLTMPILTYVQQSNDRIHVPTTGVDRMYLGGLGSRRLMLYPHMAVSYQGLNPNFAALVPVNKEDHLRVVLINLDSKPQTGQMRVWKLVPGKYRVTYGPDANDDDQMDEAVETKEMDFQRNAPIPITLPPGKQWIVEAKLIEKGVPLYERTDLAITYLDATFDPAKRTLGLRVHNIGSKPSGEYVLRVTGEDGKELFSRRMPSLDAPLDSFPRTADVFVKDLPAGIAAVTAIVTPVMPTPEITTDNNRDSIRLADLPVKRPAFGWNKPTR